MKKIILSGIFLSAIAVIYIFRLHPEADVQLTSATFVLDQSAYVADEHVKARDSVPFVENGRAFVSGRHLASSFSIPEGKNIGSPSSATGASFRDDENPARGVKNIYANKQPKDTNLTAVSQGGGTHLTTRLMAARTSAVEADKNSAPAAQAVSALLPAKNPTHPSQEALPAVGSYENLKSLLETVSSSEGYGGGITFLPGLPVAMSLASVQGKGSVPANTQDYSQTNVQVDGVDEADIVKTDGTYIYQVNRERVVVAKAFPPENMEIVSTLNYADKYFSPKEIYVDKDHLVVIGSASVRWDYPIYKGKVGIPPILMLMPAYYWSREMMKAVVYDIRDRSNIRQVRELELNGSYVSSRKVGQSLYLIANKSLYFCRGMEINEPKPSYRDSMFGDGFTEIDYPNIKYFPDFIESGYLIVAGFNLDRPDEAANVSAYLGSGQNIYASSQNLYMAVTSYPHRQPFRNFISAFEVFSESDIYKTKIYKFGMNDGRLTYEASGKVPGTVLNQFSMDEYEDCFRIATTQGDAWSSGEGALKNNVYVFDSGMNMAGKLEGIAPGEKIYSVRFMGERGYMVTFRTVDPFFVLDLKDPCNPRILGELKIPGYSNYLHPYDANHVIGFGKDAVELLGTAFYMGMKMAIFDVSDVRNPIEMFSEKIGDRGTDSELLRNHKAMLFSKDKNLLAFPVRIMEVKENSNNVLEYGSFSFQGAYVYNIDLVRGFILKGKITHLAKEDYINASNYWYDGGKDIERIIYIDDTLYTLSKGMIKANNLDDLLEIDSLEIE